MASLIRSRDFARAQKEIVPLRKTHSPIIENLACRLEDAAGDSAGALKCYQEARRAYPGYRALFYGHAEQLLQARQPAAVLQMIDSRFMRARLEVAANAGWTRADGVHVLAKPTSMR